MSSELTMSHSTTILGGQVGGANSSLGRATTSSIHLHRTLDHYFFANVPKSFWIHYNIEIEDALKIQDTLKC